MLLERTVYSIPLSGAGMTKEQEGILVIDVGGTNVKIRSTGQEEHGQDSFRVEDDGKVKMVSDVRCGYQRMEVFSHLDRISWARDARAPAC